MPITNEPLIPRNSNGVLLVLVIGRISSASQDEENIKASYVVAEKYLSQIYQGKKDIRFLGEQASGLRTDRATIREAEDLIETGKVDLVISEDLSRIYRNPRHQYNFVQDAVDQGTRVICVADNLDTTDENWEVTMSTASLRHGLFIPDTRRRIRRTATNSFHNGGQVCKIKYAYRKLTEKEAESGQFGPKDLRMAKLPDCTPIILEIRRRLMQVRKGAPVVDWLREENVPTGPYVEKGRWTTAVLKILMCDPILSGTRFFRDTIHKPIFKTGKYDCKKNPQPEVEYYSELAHMTLQEQLAMLDMMGWKLNKGEPVEAPRHPRAGIPRCRSIWPGQAAVCAICSGLMYSMTSHLRCVNSLKRNDKICWNRLQVSVELTRDRIIDWLLVQFDRHAEYREVLVTAAWEEIQRTRQKTRSTHSSKEKEIKSLTKQAVHLGKAISAGGNLETLVDMLATVESSLKKLRSEAAKEDTTTGEVQRFNSREEVTSEVEGALRFLVGNSYDFADVLRRFFPDFTIQPVQALDTGLVRPRGKLRFVPDASCNPGQADQDHDQEVELVLDLFKPAAHISAIPIFLELKAKALAENRKLSLRKMEEISGINYMTLKRSAAYIKLMKEAGTEDPYVELNEEPQNAPRWR